MGRTCAPNSWYDERCQTERVARVLSETQCTDARAHCLQADELTDETLDDNQETGNLENLNL